MEINTQIHDEPSMAAASWRVADVDLYSLFLHVLEKPGPDGLPMVMDPNLPAALLKVAEYLGVDDFPQVAIPAEAQDAESGYLSLFEVGIPAPPCPLNETAYNRADPTTKIIHENLLFYRAFGLDLAPENRELPDHISNQLEFLSYMTRLEEQSSDEDALQSIAAGKRDFIQRHVLSWIPAARQKLARMDERLYGPVFGLLEAQLRLDFDSLGCAASSRRSPKPGTCTPMT